MSAPNTKASKIERILHRQIEADRKLGALIEDGRLAARQAATIKMLTATAQSLESENARLRKYLGSVLFERRQIAVAAHFERWPNAAAAPPLGAANPETDIALRERLRHVVVAPDIRRLFEAQGYELDAIAEKYKLERRPGAASLFARPLQPVPTLRIADIEIAGHVMPGAPPLHTFDAAGRRCTRCGCSKEALLSTGEGCITETTHAA